MNKKTNNLKTALIIALSNLLIFTSFSQSPEKMSYQAIVRDASNKLVTNAVVSMKISILQGNATGTAVYTETITPSTNANGLVSIEIGTGAAFSNINWADGPYFIQTETDPAGGTNYTISGTSQLLSVPYALYAKTSGGLDNKVEKEIGKGLSTNDYSTADKSKLDAIAPGAEVNVNADWNATSGDSLIKNKPTTLAGYGITDAVAITGNQTIAGDKTFTGTTTVATPVNATDATNKIYVDALRQQIKTLENTLITAGTYKLEDIEGTKYNVVNIGTQVWMAENLKTSKYNDGTPIPNVTDATAWGKLTTGAYCDYNNTLSNSTIYGKLYNYYTVVDARKLCPTGWHVPTDAEWTTLTTFLGGESVAGGKLKEIGTTHWLSPNTGADNTSGFTALPGGVRNFDGQYFNLTGGSNWWSSSAIGPTYVKYLSVFYLNIGVTRNSQNKNCGSYVRCIRD